MKRFLTIFLAATLFFQAILPASALFSDVPRNHDFFSDVHYLEKLGIATGGKFRPDDTISQAEFSEWLLKNSGFWNDRYEPKTKRRFKDVPLAKNIYAPYIYYLVDLGIIEEPGPGRQTEFDPGRYITRINALKWLFALEGVHVPLVFEESEYQATDLRSRSPNARFIHKAIEIGILDPGETKPYHKLTRAEAARFLRRLEEYVPSIRINVLPSIQSNVVNEPEFDIFTSTWDKIFSNYLNRDELNKDELIYSAIQGLVKELDDDNSDFSRPTQESILKTLEGQVEGIGAVMQYLDEQVVVVTPLVGSPAALAGIRPNDVVIKVDDYDVSKGTFEEAILRIRGTKGTSVRLTVLREGEELVFTIVRDKILVSSVQFRRTEDNYGILELRDFGVNADTDFINAIRDFEANPVHGLVIDLRNNPGGFLDKAVNIAGHFLANGEPVVTIKYHNRNEDLRAAGRHELRGLPVAILINKGSASASEILAGALQDYGIAKVVGEQSYGKGTVQEVSEFQDGSVLKLTVAEWFTPNGNKIEGIGITPDVKISRTDREIVEGIDPQLDRALRELRGQ
ncbi:hypothetical protein COV82_02855 [Candidatus Peregrinibacteria bacterium CG11_big_fil_rev_8_21_14_0_20_46_8]|nr:MAG: hypothetical protein COV82_02855 [Candidatus Peregrinibacteria bacterium CG11_big_fil_rev_8_21_14_0_20_46_8]